MRGETGELWLSRFRNAAYVAGGAAVVWTLLMILPLAPFSSVPPILVGGGPGTWLLLGYILFLVVGFGGLSALSMLLYTVDYESKGPAGWMMSLGMALYCGGVALACSLLGIAGYLGGYASSIQRLPVTSVESILLPYVDPVTIAALAACAGAALLLVALSRSAPGKRGAQVG